MKLKRLTRLWPIGVVFILASPMTNLTLILAWLEGVGVDDFLALLIAIAYSEFELFCYYWLSGIRIVKLWLARKVRNARRASWWANKIGKKSGYLMIYFLGSVPNANVVIGVPLCRVVKLRGAFFVLMLGNINTVIFTKATVSLIFWAGRTHYWLLIVVGIAFIIHRIMKKRAITRAHTLKAVL